MSKSEDSKTTLLALVDKKEVVELEIQQILEGVPPEFRKVRGRPRLVDEQGFPRQDVDVYSIRVALNKVASMCKERQHSFGNISVRIFLRFFRTFFFRTFVIFPC